MLGLPLEQAKALLAAQGVVCSALEVRSKKGIAGGTDARIVRQIMRGEGRAELLYALFRTEPAGLAD